jgi:hypothetical protein
MLDETRGVQRRHVLTTFAAGAVLALLPKKQADAIQKPVPPTVPAVDPEDPQAKALYYVPDAADLDQQGLNLPADTGQRCSNCQLFSGTPGAEWGPCAIFSYRTDPRTKQNLVVSSEGWCKAWAPRAA